MSESDRTPNEQESFDALNIYLSAIQSGRTPERARLLGEHPDLAGAMDCLELLESVAPSPQRGTEPARSADLEATLPPTEPLDQSANATPLAAQPPAGGSEFGSYELLEEIGRGGMGVVFKARHRSLDRLVAIKMILSNHLASIDQVRRFYAEAKAAAKFNHPHIVGIHEVGQLHGQHYFVMEYVAGVSLADRLRRGPMEPTDAAACLSAIARAVEHLHASGVVHRDLKPSNILLDADGRPHVTDFGLVKMLEIDSRMTSTGAIVGTPSYMAPEQAAGRTRDVGPLSDVYSLGAILYEMLTGRPPFRAESALDTLVQVLEGEPKQPRLVNPQVPRALELVCVRCLEKSAAARYPSAAALADELDRFLAGESVEARSAGAWHRVRRWARREPALASRLAALAIVFLITQVKHLIVPVVPATLHWEVTVSLVLWAAVGVMFQRLLGNERWARSARVAWLAADAVLLTALVRITDALVSPVIVVYGLLVAGAGLWFRVRLVWFTTLVCEAAYALLVLDAGLRGQNSGEPHRHLIFAAALAVLGFVVAYQVKRVHALSRYYESRQLP